jgi:hypothetical protein
MSNNISQAASILGKKSAEKQYGHLTKEEKSKLFKELRAKRTKKGKEVILPLDI